MNAVGSGHHNFEQRSSDEATPEITSQLFSNSTTDEAHFWLNGYVNKQNCRVWSEANPQVYVETPLHLEKLTVWCALWAGGILLQKR
ncbi:hypothetical protein TNCV_1528941 [Trichonephila clavipes]|uniref:Uncharacterized protein n=1 Tax=Trichonephila clavipes TaxID=2585209 RepID=A0A8X6SGC7_TRICX|nr:hypothetical protein TNCV_1528941 [Trichonephila clavipes]